METRVLIVAFDVDGVLVENIRSILASPGQHDTHITETLLRLSHSESSIADFHTAAITFHPQIVLFVVNPRLIAATKAIIEHASKELQELQVIAVGTSDATDGIMDLLALGIADYITMPVRAADLLPRIWRLAKKQSEEGSVVRQLKESIGLEQMVGRNLAFLAEVRKIPIIARCDAGVLITGETGTGKEIFARALHYLSPRSGHPFVAVNCGAIPSELVENELFGHVRGAFTGAHAAQPGLVFEANGGTLFLDDVDALPLTAQVKFLRVLQEKEYKQLGSTKTWRADIRVVSATNTNLDEAVKIGKFRPDLFYRLNVIPFVLPSLRDRMEDLPLLAEHFIEKYSYEFGKGIKSLSADSLALLMTHDWSGNVRELENVMERAVVFCTGSVIEPAHIILPNITGHSAPVHTESLREAKAKMVAQFEKGYIEDLLRTHRGNISKAARAAQKNRRAFWELLRKYKVNAEILPD